MREKKQFVVGKIKVEIDYDSSHSLSEVETVIRNGVEEVDKFFSFSDIRPGTINFELMYSRQEYNKRLGRETENWMSARVEDGVIIILDPDALEKYSSHSRNEFPAIVVHELIHIFTQAINKPTLDWVNEGLAQYVAGQDSKRPIDPDDFNYFLENHLVTNTGYNVFISHSGYRISFLLVSYMVEKYGKSVITRIVSLPGDADCTQEIERIFATTIGEVNEQLRQDITERATKIDQL